MKILHVCKKYPPVLGGDAVVVANLQKQQAQNHNVVIVTSNCNEIPSGNSIYKVGLKDTSAGLDAITPRRIVSLFMLGAAMVYILYKERPQVIHTHSVDMAFFVSIAARLFGVPIIHTFHIVTFYDANQSALRRKSELWLAKRAKSRFVTAPNRYDVERLRSAGLSQTVLLPNGVDTSFWQRPALTKKSEPFRFVAVGRLEHQKGYEYLIKAAAMLVREQAGDFRLTIVGEGSQKQTLQALADELGAGEIVQFVGRKTPKQTRSLLTTAGALVCTSLYETTPLTLLEAWAAAVPVISTPVGILRDVPYDFAAAFIVPPKDEYLLMEAMRAFLTDQTSRTVVAANGHKEAQRYTWPVINQTAEALYGDAL